MLHSPPLSIRFDDERSATAIRVPPHAPLHAVLDVLCLPPHTGIVIVHGGAGGMEPELIEAVRRFVTASLAPLAEARRLLIVDGGTQAGVSGLMGEARQAIGGTYALLGVVPHRSVTYPGGPPPNGERIPLNPSHTHFVLVDGDEFGVESSLLVGLLRACAWPGLALIINGGQIVFNEVLDHARQGNTLVTVRGSGRIADQLADSTSPERAALPPGTRLHIADLDAPEAFTALLSALLV